MLAEQAIVAQLKATVQSGADAWARAVGTRTDAAAVTEEMQLAPAVYVVYDGFSVLSASEFDATLGHRWLVVIAVANAAAGPEAAPRNQEAGPYTRDVLAALHGFLPAECRSALVPVTPPRPFFSPAKFAYYPLAFVTESYHCKTQ